jgi:hypothetical protein
MSPDDRREARSYAWGYFEVHADQRMKLFNFFLILSGVIVGAVPAVRSMEPGTRTVAFLPLLLVLVAFIFWRLEQRTRLLVKNGEEALKFLDKQWPVEPSSDGSPHPLRLLERDDYLTEKLKECWWAKCGVPVTYAKSFRLAYLIIGGLGLLMFGWLWFVAKPESYL